MSIDDFTFEEIEEHINEGAWNSILRIILIICCIGIGVLIGIFMKVLIFQ